MHVSTVLASDIDNTLAGDDSALHALRTELDSLRARGGLALFLVTGRRLEQVIAGWRDEGLPAADAVITQVGTEVYLPPYALGDEPLAEWTRQLLLRYDRRRAMRFVAGIDGLEMQSPLFNTSLKVSCDLSGCRDPAAAVRRIRHRAREASADYQVVWSSGRDLDVLPARAGKGNAIRFVIEHLDLAPRRVIVAGDSGNDESMFEAFDEGIVVANAQAELREYAARRSTGEVYVASRPYAGGVHEGLRHFGLL